MRLFRKLKTSNKEEAKEAMFGLGFVEAMDYDTQKRGHLILASLTTKKLQFVKTVFLPL